MKSALRIMRLRTRLQHCRRSGIAVQSAITPYHWTGSFTIVPICVPQQLSRSSVHICTLLRSIQMILLSMPVKHCVGWHVNLLIDETKAGSIQAH